MNSKIIRWAAVPGILTLVLAACVLTPAPRMGTPEPAAPEGTPPAAPGAADPLTDSQWILTEITQGGEKILPLEGTQVALQFGAAGDAFGMGGCNNYSTAYTIQGDTIAFGEVVSTKMACTPAGVMEQEQQYLSLLQEASVFALADSTLTLSGAEGQFALNFARAGAPAETIPAETPPADQTPAIAGLCSQVGPAEGENGSDWLVCRSEQYGFEVQTPLDSVLVQQTATTARFDLPFGEGTNLSEKFLDITAVEDAETCTSPRTAGYAPGAIQGESVQLNGVDFVRESGQDAAAGSVYQWTAYSTRQGSLCVSLDFVLRSFHPELVETPPALFDLDAESAVFEASAATFRWLEAGGGFAPALPATEGSSQPEAERIRFAAGATTAEASGSLEASGSRLYVIEALRGQLMQVDLTFTQGAAILAVWGEDGAVLMSDHAESPSFRGILPATQDYFIQVKGSPDGPVKYRMAVTIPPL